MADFWIKVEKGTPDKAEVLEMSAILNISDPDTVVGKLVRVWGWFDSNSENGHAPSVTNVLLDRVTGVAGFCDAMCSVGWLSKNEDGYQIPNYDRHLGQSAKKRASDAERKRKSREMSQNKCDINRTFDGTEIGLEKSREDKTIKTLVKPSAKVDVIPYQKIVDSYNTNLPMLRRCVKVTDKIKNTIRKSWNADERHQNFEFWDRYFSATKMLKQRIDFWSGVDGGAKQGLDLIARRDIFERTIEELIDMKARR